MSFQDIIGHSEAISFLRESLRKGVVSPVYLFTGPEAIGKKKVAFNFAKSLNCIDVNQAPCDKCIFCRKTDTLNSPDIRLIAPSGKGSVIKIDDIRILKKEANLKPYESRIKVFIIDNAETMTQEASNSLLKILEEASQSNVFILITSNLTYILPTIKSRTVIVKFKVNPVGDVRDMLVKKFNVDKSRAYFIAKFSGGRIGEAIEMETNQTCEKKNALIDKTHKFLLSKKGAIDYSDWECQDRALLKKNLEFLQSWFRDIFIAKIKENDELIFNCDRSDEIFKMARLYSFEELNALIEKLVKLESYVDANVNPKIIVDTLLCELVNSRRTNETTKIKR